MDPKALLRLFRTMLRIRLVEETIADLYPAQEMRCPVHLCIGQEAIAAGVCESLEPADYALSGHRSHGHYLAKGGDLKAMMAELYGKATGCSLGKGGSMHLIDLRAGFLGATPIVASAIPIAVGTAFASSMRGERRVTAVFFGEAATEEGVFHESVNFAALKKLPVVFVCENNLYSVHSPLSVRQPPERRLVDLAAGHGIWAEFGDGNDVEEVSDLARHAVGWARSGRGPAFLELETYRWREHCGPAFDNDLGYREKREFKEWRERCPLDLARERLAEEEIVSPEELDRIEADIRAGVDEAVSFAKRSPFPDPKILLDQVYAPRESSDG